MKLLCSIRFNARQVIAARAGTLTQVRAPAYAYDPEDDKKKLAAYGRAEIGDLLWVGEPWIHFWDPRKKSIQTSVYEADYRGGSVKTPDFMRGVHCKRHTYLAHLMKRADSRLTLVVTAVRFETLHSIIAEDAEASGLEMFIRDGAPWFRSLHSTQISEPTPAACFLKEWEKMRGKDSFRANPVVAALTFRLIEKNADEYLREQRAGQRAARVADEVLGAP